MTRPKIGIQYCWLVPFSVAVLVDVVKGVLKRSGKIAIPMVCSELAVARIYSAWLIGSDMFVVLRMS